MKFDLCGLSYYESGNLFTGSAGDFCFKIRPEEGRLRASLWRGPFCFDKSEIVCETDFSLDETGFEQLHLWLEKQYGQWEQN